MIDEIKELASKFDSCLTIADMDNPLRPLIFVNHAFVKHTGYSEEESVGRNCSFLQGRLTDANKIKFMRESFENNFSCCVDLVNYKKDGTPFWNRLVMLPIKVDNKKYFIGLQNDVTEKKHKQYNEKSLELVKQSEICHKINNPLMIALAINTQFNNSNASDPKHLKLISQLKDTILRIENFVINLEDQSEFENWKY